jgi:hypothetical protein
VGKPASASIADLMHVAHEQDLSDMTLRNDVAQA